MSYGYAPQPQNLQFYPSQYTQPQPVSGHSTPFQAYPSGSQAGAYGGYGGQMSSQPDPGFGIGGGGFGGPVTGNIGQQGGLRMGWIAALTPEGYDGEPSLWEELGLNTGHIWAKTLSVLNPLRRVDQHLMDDSDLFGPIFFFLAFGIILRVSGKVHFGFIYGLALIGSTLIHVILSLMSPPLTPADIAANDPSGHGKVSSHFSSTLSYTRSASILGYCLLPLVFTAVFGVALNMDSVPGYALTCLAILWSTYSSSGIFCAVGRMDSMRFLVAYPLALFFLGFGIMSIFSSRGTGAMAKAAVS